MSGSRRCKRGAYQISIIKHLLLHPPVLAPVHPLPILGLNRGGIVVSLGGGRERTDGRISSRSCGLNSLMINNLNKVRFERMPQPHENIYTTITIIILSSRGPRVSIRQSDRIDLDTMAA